jgi:hypothetical protein
MEQRYTSSLLTHFVARDKPTPDEQFAVLLTILRNRALLSQTARMNPQYRHKAGHIAASRIAEEDDLNLQYSLYVVCFADIPLTDLSLHIAKYSPFGISFSKEFLIRQGASPVFYVCVNAIDTMTQVDLDSVFRNGLNAFHEWSKGRANEVILQMFLTMQVFSMMKFWKYIPENHAEDNYYMEREWRIPTRVDFSLADARRLIMPREYILRLREAFPEYAGDVLCYPIGL